MHYQPKIGEPRGNYQSYLNKELRDAIKKDTIRWKCSTSWIIATALAAFYDVNIIRPSDLNKSKTKKRKKINGKTISRIF